MARIRSIHPGLATDEAYMAMSPLAKAAWPNLWTECDDSGIFEWKPIVLKARLLPADAVDFGDLLEEWVLLNAVKKFEIAGKSYGLVRNFRRFQRPKKPNHIHFMPPEFRDYAGLTDDSTEPVRNRAPSGGVNPPQMEDGEGVSSIQEGERPKVQQLQPRGLGGRGR